MAKNRRRPTGTARAVAIIGQIADLAKKSELRVALYPHLGYYVDRVEHAVRLAKKTGRGNVGVSFNLCHFLKLDDEKNLDRRLKESMPCLFLVTINGADRGQTNNMGWDRLIQTLDRGSFQVSGLLKTLKQLGYTGPICLQSFGIGGDARDNLRCSMEAWRRLAATVQREQVAGQDAFTSWEERFSPQAWKPSRRPSPMRPASFPATPRRGPLPGGPSAGREPRDA